MEEYEYTGKAMGTEFSISIVCNSKERADKLSNQAIVKIQSYENRFSRFLKESELSILNDKKEMAVSSEFLKVTQEARALYTLTQKNFNPLVQIARFGYTKNFNDIDNTDEVKNTEDYSIDFSTTIIDEKNSKIILQKGQKLDFGGFLKGYVTEKICKELKNCSQDVIGVIVNIGGDLHTQGVDEQGQEFIFNIYNPITKTEDISVPIHNQSLATSGTYKRTWQNKSQQVHHILDYSGNKNPETDIVSVSIIHPEGAKAEAFTKVFLSVGIDKAQEILKTENFKSICITKDGTLIK